MKFIFLIIPILLFSTDDFQIQPIGKIQLRYEAKSHTYSQLGQTLYQEDKINYHDYIFGGSFGLQASLDDYTFSSLLYSTMRIHDKNLHSRKNEKSFYNNDLNGFAFLGELNIKKNFNNHTLVLGRQSYDSPLVNSNYRITQNSYEGIKYGYDEEKFHFSGLYFHKIASSTLANNIPYNHKYGFLGYGFGYDTSHFQKISKHIINQDLSSNTALHFVAKYGEDNTYISYENLFVKDFFNTSNLTFSYNLNHFYFQLGMISQFSVGEKYIERYIEASQKNKKLKSQLYQMKIEYKLKDFSIAYSLSRTPSNENHIYKGTLLSPFSNRASWLVGLNTAHATIADTTSQKLSVSKLFDIVQLPTLAAAGYIQYHIGQNNGLSTKAQNTSEWYCHLQQPISKNLSTTLQYSKNKNYDPLTHKSYNVRAILSYKF